MPPLSEISYSRDACIVAVRGYYEFLTNMYLKESAVIKPPEGGWSSITSDSLRDLDKTDEVISLLRHLPYIGTPNNASARPQGSPWCYWADWQLRASNFSLGHISSDALKVNSEGADFSDDVPAHVIGLTSGGRENPVFLLDTQLGIVHWVECPDDIRYGPSREKVEDDAYDYAPDNEAEWRADAPAWPIADFFELLKDQFRELKFVPISSRTVFDVYTTFAAGTDGMMDMLQSIYREHNWPNLERYHKEECLEAVQTALEEQYPQEADWRDE